jgi:hypothetical protein
MNSSLTPAGRAARPVRHSAAPAATGGIEHGGFGARHELDQRTGLVRQADLGETGGARQFAGAQFMCRIFPAMQEGDGAGAEAGARAAVSAPHQRGFVERQDRAIDRDAFGRFDDAGMQGRRFADVEREDVRPRLVANSSASAKPALVISTTGSPLWVSRALVPTVVPILTLSITPSGMASPAPGRAAGECRRWRHPGIARDCRTGVSVVAAGRQDVGRRCR